MLCFTDWAIKQVKEKRTVKENDWDDYVKKASKTAIKEASNSVSSTANK